MVLTALEWPWNSPTGPWVAPTHPERPFWATWGPWGCLGIWPGQSGASQAFLVLWGPLQVSMNMYFSMPETNFVLQISQPPEITQNWFCIQNLHMDLSFQKKKTVLKSVHWFRRYQTNKHLNVFFETPCIYPFDGQIDLSIWLSDR